MRRGNTTERQGNIDLKGEVQNYMCQKVGSLSNFDKLLIEKMVEWRMGTIDKYGSLLAAYQFYVKNNTPEA